MIEKLLTTETICGTRYPSNVELTDKINELIDRVNNLEPKEPKFKVGNWYQCTKDFFGKGVNFDKNTAYYCAQEGCLQCKYGCHIAIVKDLYDNFKLWTIQDARNGDVLVSDADQPFLYNGCLCEPHVGSHCGLSIGGVFKVCDTNAWANKLGVHPATKEQRDALFAEIARAGYEWIEESKELRKIPTPADVGFEELGKAWEREAKDTKVHIDISDGISPSIALECVKQVIDKKGHFASSFTTTEGKVWVYKRPYRVTDCFLVYKREHNEDEKI